jgi:signal transduction histidine kinase
MAPARVEALVRHDQAKDRVSRGLLQRLLEAERGRIAQVLHDSAGQTLSAAVLELEQVVVMLSDQPGSQPGARPLVAEAIELCQQSLEGIRTLSYELNPPLLTAAGLALTLAWYVSAFARRAGLRVVLRTSRGVGRAAPEVELALFRVVQEALLNVRRHSGSRSAVVLLERREGELRVEVRDRGRGLDHDGATHLPGAGMRGMREGVEGCGGRIEFHSSAKGTRVLAVVPA